MGWFGGGLVEHRVRADGGVKVAEASLDDPKAPDLDQRVDAIERARHGSIIPRLREARTEWAGSAEVS